MELALKSAKIKNKAKYPPKKYKNIYSYKLAKRCLF